MPFGYAPESAANLERQNLPLVNSGFVAVGICLTGIEFLIANLGERFFYEVDFARAPIVFYVGLLLAAGLVYLPLRWLIPRLAPSRHLLVTLILIGLLARVLLFGSNPILEIDYYRYLWDGAVLANGFSPYALPPAEVPGSDLSMLAIQAGAVFERINYRELSSIYPPLAQALFALAYWLDAWQLDGLRLLLLIADLSTLYLILKILRRLNYSPYWACLYWWNPLLVTLTYNALHMDALLLPFLMAALWLLIRQKSVAACGALTLAAGIKLWPLLLLPFALRNLLDSPRRLMAACGVVLIVAGVSILPMLILWPDDHSGLAAFSQQWERNSALFPQLVNLLSMGSTSPGLHARILVAVVVTLLVFYLLRNPVCDSTILIRQITITIAVLFLLSPVQLPWYCLWLLPFLCFYPHPALLLLTTLMPIYFLRFYFDFRGQVEIFDQWIVWCQYLPPLLLLIITRGRYRLTFANQVPRHV
jgi:alpha-1,6-mannosyltransferase